MTPEALKTDFYDRDTVTVTRELLGKVLCRRSGDHTQRLIINEVEAYDGESDLACHASRGRTARTEVLYGPPAHWYVYLCYGVHWMVNVVVGAEDYPAAVLLRGAGDIVGPGRLTRRLQINADLNTLPISRRSGLWIEDHGLKVQPCDIVATPRIGIDRVPEPWRSMPYRFVLKSQAVANS